MVEETTALNNRTPDIRFGRIKPFAGKRETLEKFLGDITLHHLLNKIKEDALSYCEGGDADSWKTAFIKKSIIDGRVNFGTWKDFVDDLIKNFKPYDAQGDAGYAQVSRTQSQSATR